MHMLGGMDQSGMSWQEVLLHHVRPSLRASGLLLTCVVANREVSYIDLNCMYCKQIRGCLGSLRQGLGPGGGQCVMQACGAG